jgi:YVTN family beta-propeller protein
MLTSGLVIWGSEGRWGQPAPLRSVAPGPTAPSSPPQGRAGYLAGTTVGAYPEGIAFDPENGFLYVTNHNYQVPQSTSCASAPGLSTVTIFSGSNDTIMGTVVVGKAAAGIAFDSHLNEMYVANCGSNNVSVINTLTNTILGSFGVGTAPMGVAYLPASTAIAVANSGSNNVSLVGGMTVVGSYPVGIDPQFLVDDLANTLLDVTNYGSANVTTYNTQNAAKSSIPVGTDPEGIEYNPVLKHVYTANFASGNVSIISGTSVLASVPVGSEPWGVVYDRGTNAIYVTNTNGGNVSVLQNDKVVASVEPFTTAASDQLTLLGVAYDQRTGDLFFANQQPNPGQVLVLAGATYLPGVGAALGPIAGAPLGAAVGASGIVYFVNEAGSNMTSYGSAAEASHPVAFKVGLHPHAVVYDPVVGELFVANTGSDNVSVFSLATDTVVAWIPVGSSPEAIAYDPTNGQIDVANFGDGTVSVISDTSNIVVATITVGIGPSGIAVSNGFVFVVNSGSDSMTEIDGSNNTAFASYGTGANPQAIVVDNGVGYIANLGSDNVTEFSSGAPSIRSSTPVPAGGTFDGISAADGYVYLAEPSIKQVAVLSEQLAQPSGGEFGTIGWIHTPSTPDTLTFDSVTGYLYVASGVASNAISAFVTRGNAIESVLGTNKLAGTTTTAIYDAFNGEIYVAEEQANAVAVFTPGLATPKIIPVGHAPDGGVYDPVTDQVYITNGVSDNVSIIGTSNTVLHSVNVGTRPRGAAFDSLSGDVVVSNFFSNNISVISGQVVTHTLPAGLNPVAVAFDPVTHDLYVANDGGSNLTVYSGGAAPVVLSSYPVGLNPDALAVDPVSGDLYVGRTTATLANLTIISPTDVHTSVTLPLTSIFTLVWDNGSARLYIGGQAVSAASPLGVLVWAGGSIVRGIGWGISGVGVSGWDPVTGDIYLTDNNYLHLAVVVTGL